MSTCKNRNCNAFIGFLEHYCDECTIKIAGKKPPKTKKICCQRCAHNHRNLNRKKGCWEYDEAELVIKPVYTHKSQSYPTPRWRLRCFESKINKQKW